MSEALLITCRNCGVSNRVPREKIGHGLEPVCGRCKTSLSLTLQPLTVTDATFADLVERSQLPVLLDIWAEWCGPCHMIAPSVEELAIEMSGRVLVAKINLDENPATARRFNVQSIPTLLVLRSGKEVDRIVGAQPKPEIKRRLEVILGN